MLEPSEQFTIALEADKRRALDALTFEQRALAGLVMYDMIAESIRAGLRMEDPAASEDVIHERFLRRMQEIRERDEWEADE